MSHLTDHARARARALDSTRALPTSSGHRFETLLDDPRVPRRMVLRGGFAGSLATLLAACGGGGDDAIESTLATAATNLDAAAKPASLDSLAVTFSTVGESKDDAVVVPEGYVAQRLFSAGDAVEGSAAPYASEYPSTTRTRRTCWTPTARSRSTWATTARRGASTSSSRPGKCSADGAPPTPICSTAVRSTRRASPPTAPASGSS